MALAVRATQTSSWCADWGMFETLRRSCVGQSAVETVRMHDRTACFGRYRARSRLRDPSDMDRLKETQRATTHRDAGR